MVDAEHRGGLRLLRSNRRDAFNCKGAVFLNLEGVAKAVFGDWKMNYWSFEIWKVILMVISFFGGRPEMLITMSIRVSSGTVKADCCTGAVFLN